MKFLIRILFLFLIILNLSSETYTDDDDEKPDLGYEKLLKWGLSHNLTITEKIRFIKEKSTKYYIAKNLIPESDIIMDIPPECMLNINNTLSLLDSKKFKKAYERYVEIEKMNQVEGKDNHRAEQAFIAYVLYIVKKHPKKYKKNKFVKYFKPMFYMFDENLDNLPFYFSSDQMKLFFNTSFGSIFDSMTKLIQEESSIFEKKIFNETVDFEDYLRYRIFTVQKSIQVNKTLNLVPFTDYVKRDFQKINCEFFISPEDHIIVRAKSNIFPGEELIMNPFAISNDHRFIFFGDTFEELKDRIQSFNIPSLIPSYITDKPVDFNIESLGPKARMDLIEIDFYKPIIFVYKKFARLIGEDDSDMNACKLMLKYLNRIKDNYDIVTKDKIREEFLREKDVENVWRIVDGERQLINRRIEILKIYMKNQEERAKQKKNYDAEDVNDL
jgi:hypothetical protein